MEDLISTPNPTPDSEVLARLCNDNYTCRFRDNYSCRPGLG